MLRPALAAVLALTAAPALGQQPSPSAQGPQTSAPSTVAAEQSTAAQARMRRALEQAGFKQIHFGDAIFAVRARTADGETAVMYVNPPIPAGAPGATTTGPVADRAGAALARTQLRQSLEKSGFRDVTVVGAAYHVAAETPAGGRALMYVHTPVAHATSGSAGQTRSPPQPGDSKPGQARQ